MWVTDVNRLPKTMLQAIRSCMGDSRCQCLRQGDRTYIPATAVLIHDIRLQTSAKGNWSEAQANKMTRMPVTRPGAASCPSVPHSTANTDLVQKGKPGIHTPLDAATPNSPPAFMGASYRHTYRHIVPPATSRQYIQCHLLTRMGFHRCLQHRYHAVWHMRLPVHQDGVLHVIAHDPHIVKW